MKKVTAVLLLILSLFVLGACSNSEDNTHPDDNKKESEKKALTISAAISLGDALEEMKTVFEAEHPIELTFNLGGSGKLAQQIQQGAPVDLFISANQDWMDTLEEENLIISETRTNITGNKIVLITGKDADITYDSIEAINPTVVKQVAIGNPETVPAGKYTEQVLRNINKWDELKDSFVLAKDVRQVLTYVETGNANIGFVYESDAKQSDQIKILATADDKLHDPIIYPAAIVNTINNEEEAYLFLDFLKSDNAQKILESYGFKQ